MKRLENILYELIENHIFKIKKYLEMDLKYEENKLVIVINLVNKIDEIYNNSKFNKFKNNDMISNIIYFLYNNRKPIIQNYKKF